MKDFCHLHNHTEFSLLDSTCWMDSMARLAKNLGMKSIAMTDHCNMAGAVKFYHTVKKYGLKPIIGYEGCLTPLEEEGCCGDTRRNNLHHLTLLARNQKGLKNLFRISSRAVIEKGRFRSTMDMDMLNECGEGLICLSGCKKSRLNYLVLNDRIEMARRWLEDMRSIFGKDCFYVELQNHGLHQQERIQTAVIRLAETINIPTVATNDTHYLYPEDKESYDVLRAIGEGKTLNELERDRYDSGQLYFKSGDEMARLFPEKPEAIRKTLLIAEMCEAELDTSLKIPGFRQDRCESSLEYLHTLAAEGLKSRYGAISSEMRERLDYELNIIQQTGHADWYLLARDCIRNARKKYISHIGTDGIISSLTAHAIGLTDINPMDYELNFDLFLDPGGNNRPEIVVDVSEAGHEYMMNYVKNLDGPDSHAHSISFGIFWGHICVRQVGKAMSVPTEKIEHLAELTCRLPVRRHCIKSSLKEVPELRAFIEKDEEAKRLIKCAQTLERLPWVSDMPQVDMVIADRPMWEYVPLCKINEGTWTTQWTIQDLERMGILELDVFACKPDTLIEITLENIDKKNERPPVMDATSLDLKDEETYRMLGEGNTEGVFLFGSEDRKELLSELKPQSIEDLIAAVVLSISHSHEHGIADEHITCKRVGRQTACPHPSLSDILKNTYGLILYREQIVRIYREIAGMGSAEALSMIGARKMEDEKLIERSKQRFICGVERTGGDREEAFGVWELLMRFAGYVYSKSEAADDALMAYRTAYLKAHFPGEFEEALKTYDDVF